jgi:MFS family permease
MYKPAKLLAMQKHDPYSALRHGAYRRFLGGALAQNLGGQFVTVAVGWQLYEQTHSYLALMFIGLANYIPILLFSLPAGLAADRFERRRILQLTTLGVALSFGGLLALSVWGGPEWAWYALLFSAATARAFHTPAAVSFYPTLLPQEQMLNAVSWNSSNYQVGAIVGPAIGGLLFRLGGAPLALAGGAMGPLAFCLLLSSMRPLREPDPGLRGVGLWERLSGGMRFVYGQKEIFAAITLDLFAVLFGGVEGIMPAFAKDILNCGPLGLGFLMAAPFAGAFVMGFILAHRPMVERAGPTMLKCVAGFGICMLVFGLSGSLALSLAALFVSGALDLVSVVVRQTLVQLRTPEGLRGRVQAVNFFFIGSSNEMGYAESGVMASIFGAVPSVLIGGALTLAVVALVSWKMPQLRNLGSLK